ncbi:hypothetical protein GGI23_007441, partial [Coemansia sp. RSA 2559]
MGSLSHAFTSGQSSTGVSPSPAKQQKGNKDDDPFGELVSFSSDNSPTSQKAQANMTLRERQQALESQSNASSTSKGPGAVRTDMWNFDALEQASNSSRSNIGTPVQQTSARSVRNATSPRDLDPLFSGSAQARAASNSDIMSGLDLLSDSPISNTSPSPSPFMNSRTGLGTQKSSKLSKDPFNLNVDESSDDDDAVDGHRPNQPPVSGQSDSFADRDYEISQIVGYGFSVEQARAALEITGSVRAAVQLLREQQATESHLKNQKTSRPTRQKNFSRYRDDSD